MVVTPLHNEALDLADEATFLRRKGKIQEAISLFGEAYELEFKAALESTKYDNHEPTRSILLKSAAALAVNANQHDNAIKAVHLALSGNPPVDIREELDHYLEELTFSKHLSVIGVELGESDIQFSLNGPAVSYGTVKYEELGPRVQILTKMVTRTAERRKQRPFRTTGRATKEADYSPYISVGRPNSFAVTIKFGFAESAQTVIGTLQQPSVVMNVLEYVSMIQDGQIEAVRERIGDRDYFNNFISLVKALAPDGKRISMVGFSYKFDNEIKELPFRMTRAEVTKLVTHETKKKSENEFITAEGKFKAVDSDKSKIKFSTSEDKSYLIKVSKSLDDVVKLYWGEIVTVRLQKKKGEKNGTYNLIEIHN